MIWLVGLALAALSTSPAGGQGDRFAYKFEMTPEEGHVDPAIQKRYGPQFNSCQKRARVTSEVAGCFEAEFTRQDAVLNRTWKAIFHRVPTSQQGALLEAQRKWIDGRDPFCRTASDAFSGGTIAPVVYSNCRVEQTIRRTIWLEALR